MTPVREYSPSRLIEIEPLEGMCSSGSRFPQYLISAMFGQLIAVAVQGCILHTTLSLHFLAQVYHDPDTYDRLNRLIGVSGVGISVNYSYNGLGDRLSETANSQTTHYTMDLNAGLTQVLQDGTNTYLYGAGRVAQYGERPEYYLGDALGSGC